MVEWNGIFRLFRFSGILGQPREVHPKFRNEIRENDCSIRPQTRNFRNFWSNGKRPKILGLPASRRMRGLGAFVWDQSGIRIVGIMQVSVCLRAILIPEYLDFHSGYSSPRSRIAGIYSGISQTNAPLV